MSDDGPVFGSVLGEGPHERSLAWLVIPAATALLALLVFAGYSISRASGLQAQLAEAVRANAEFQRAVEQRDAELRRVRIEADHARTDAQQARAQAAAIVRPPAGAAVLAPFAPGGRGSGVVLSYPESKAAALFAFDLPPAPADQEYQIVATTADGTGYMLGALSPDPQGKAQLVVQHVPDGAQRIELALLPRAVAEGAAAQGTGAGEAVQANSPAKAERITVVDTALPQGDHAGVVLPAKRAEGGKLPRKHG